MTTSQAGGTGNQPQTVVLASRSQGGALVLQPGGAQQILLPPGALNIKTLQGLKVIPLAQATGNTTAGKGELLNKSVNHNQMLLQNIFIQFI